MTNLKKVCYNTSVIRDKGPKKGIDTMKKLTKIEMFTQIMKGLTNADEIAFIQHEIELLENKKASVRKPTSNQLENENFKVAIVDFLKGVENATISDMMEKIPCLKEVSNQRISAILKQLVDGGVVVKAYEKRKAYFSVER